MTDGQVGAVGQGPEREVRRGERAEEQHQVPDVAAGRGGVAVGAENLPDQVVLEAGGEDVGGGGGAAAGVGDQHDRAEVRLWHLGEQVGRGVNGTAAEYAAPVSKAGSMGRFMTPERTAEGTYAATVTRPPSMIRSWPLM